MTGTDERATVVLITLLAGCAAVILRDRKLRCGDCGKPYRDLPLDVALTDEQWALISDRPDGVLCAGCIVARAAKLPGITVAKMVLE